MVDDPGSDDPDAGDGVLTDPVITVGESPGQPDPTACRPHGVSETLTAGFPLPEWSPASLGTLRAAVLFVDFPDAAARHSTQHEFELGFADAEYYLREFSYGKLDLELVALHRWLRIEQGHARYLSENGELGGVEFNEATVRLADSEFDFTDISVAIVVMPSSNFSFANFGGAARGGMVRTDEGTIVTARANVRPFDEPREPARWGGAVHELVHGLGLLDMYPFDSGRHELPEEPRGAVWFGLMGLRTYFPDVSESADFAWEMLAWSRWQLGWLDAEQVRCVTTNDATVILGPIAYPGAGIAMAAVPLSDIEVIVIESRRATGLDVELATDGVLVYTVDAALGSGQLPVKVARDTGDGQIDDYPILSVGQSVTVRGYTITVIADDGDTHTVTITRTGGG